VECTPTFIKFNLPNVTFVLHHGITPASVKNRRTDFSAPLSVSFCGWGR
jgi:hypothetical protein